MQSHDSQISVANRHSVASRWLARPSVRAVAGAVISSAVLMAIAVFSPVSLSAGLFCNHGINPCQICTRPCGTCHVQPCQCAASRPVVQQQLIQRPVLQQQIQMVPQTQTVPVTTYRDEVRTEYRTQAEQLAIPVTQYKTVAVDEGSYQQVWVPRVVQKQVPETVYQQQTVYRQVPYQFTQRVPQVSYQTQTTMVPQTVSRVVPQTVQTAAAGCSPCGTATAWNSYGATYPSAVSTAPVTMPTIAAAPYATFPAYPTVAGSAYPSQIASASPVTLGPELEPLGSSRASYGGSIGAYGDSGTGYGGSNSLAPISDPIASGNWTAVPLATAAPSPVPAPRADEASPRTSAANGRFVPAPSAANVFRTRLR